MFVKGGKIEKGKGERGGKSVCMCVFVGHIRSELNTETIRIKAQLLPGEADTHAQNNVRPRLDNAGSSGL